MQRRELLALGAIAACAAAPLRALAQGRMLTAQGFAATGDPVQGGWLRGRAPAGAGALTLDGAPVALGPDGAFFIGWDRDAPAQSRLVAALPGQRSAVLQLPVAPRTWAVQHVDAPLRPGALGSEAYRLIRAAELARINAARAAGSGAAGWRQDFIAPVAARISGNFGAQRVYRGQPGAYHTGMDFAAATGTPWRAPADGVVILAAQSPFTLEGLLLMVDHGMGLSSAFLHASRLLVREGERVGQGQPLGLVGQTGRATGPHLHWGLKWNAARLDPARFI